MKKTSHGIIKEIIVYSDKTISFILENKHGRYKDNNYNGTTNKKILVGSMIEYSTIDRMNYSSISCHIYTIKDYTETIIYEKTTI